MKYCNSPEACHDIEEVKDEHIWLKQANDTKEENRGEAVRSAKSQRDELPVMLSVW